MENLKLRGKGKRLLSEPEIIRKVRWAQALEACEQYHIDLMKCRKTSIFGLCNEESELFWKCVNSTFMQPTKSQSDEKPPS